MSQFTKIDTTGAPVKPAVVAVLDTKSNLMWSATTIGGKRMTWEEAAAACASLTLGGFSDWRLPTVEELFALADRTRRNPAIDTEYFECESSWYWSSTTSAASSSDAWGVFFNGGYSNTYNRDVTGFVRAVRSASASQ